MDYPGQVAPMIPNVDQYAQFKANQEKVLQQHKAYAQQLQQKQDLLQKRGGDLDLADRLLKIMDSKLPKPAREFLAKGLAQQVGVDPKAQSAKDISKLITSMDPDTLMAMRSQFASSLEGAAPGQIQETVHGILSGQVDINQFMNHSGLQFGGGENGAEGGGEAEDQGAQEFAAGSSSEPPRPTSMSEAPAPQGAGTDESPLQITNDATGAPPSDPSLETSTAVASQGVARGTDPAASAVPAPFSGGPNDVSSFETQRTFLDPDKPASPMIVHALGLDSKVEYRNKDLAKFGVAIPSDPNEQNKLAEDLATRSTGMSSTMVEASQLVDIFKNKPYVLGQVGQGVRTVQSTIRQAQGLLQLMKGPSASIDELSPGTSALAKRVGDKIAALHGLDKAAADSAAVESSVLSLAYRMAIANDIPGNRLTNAIITQNLQMIGKSSSPEQFQRVLSDMLEKTTREFDETLRRKIGVSGLDIVARGMTDTDIKGLVPNADILPRDLSASLQKEVDRRAAGGKAMILEPSHPTLQEERQTLGRAETSRKQLEQDKLKQTMQIDKDQEARALRNEDRANKREDRITAAAEASQKLQREEFQYRKQKDIQAQAQHQQDKIAAAFARFGAAIAGSRGGGGGGVSMPSNPAQDPSAFRITPAPQRVPPRVKQ